METLKINKTATHELIGALLYTAVCMSCRTRFLYELDFKITTNALSKALLPGDSTKIRDGL